MGIKHTVWKAMKPLQFKISIESRALLPSACLRTFQFRASPATAEEFADEATDFDSSWVKLHDDCPALRVMWSESVAVMPNERQSQSTGEFDWPELPVPHVVMSQVKFGELRLVLL
jgi:hypothetical protein